MAVPGKGRKDDVPTFGMTRVRRSAARLEVRENEGRTILSEPLHGRWVTPFPEMREIRGRMGFREQGCELQLKMPLLNR